MVNFSEEQTSKLVEQIKQNQQLRLSGKPLPVVENSINISAQEQDDPQEEESPPKPTGKSLESPQQQQKNYAYAQAQINNTVAQFQVDKLPEIVHLARKDKITIFKYEDPDDEDNDKLIPMEIRYRGLRTKTRYKLEEMRAKISDLQNIKSRSSASLDANGNLVPPEFTKNDPKKTGISDKVFLNINSEIDKLNKEITEQMAWSYYRISKDDIPNLEDSSFKNAMEAGLYREIYGVVGDSKNSGVF